MANGSPILGGLSCTEMPFVGILNADMLCTSRLGAGLLCTDILIYVLVYIILNW